MSILSSFTALIQFLSNQVKLMRTVTTKKERKKTVPETTWKSRTKLFTPRGNGKSRKEKKIPKVGYIDTKFFFCFPPAAGARFALKIAIDGRVGVQTIDTRLLTTLFDLFFAC